MKIVAPNGAGGMGEVYRARDSGLNREVAVEVLPARRHPPIATVFRIEQGAPTMEPVVGPTPGRGNRGARKENRMPGGKAGRGKAKGPAGPVEGARGDLQEELEAALRWLELTSTAHDRANLARFGIAATRAFGVSMANIQALAKRVGRSHELAAALWESGHYEARLLAALVDEPERVTAEQMDRWMRDFDNWGVCDTVCFKLFDRTPHAWAKVAEWSEEKDEFGRRAAFALLASLAGHDRDAGNERFLAALPLVERAAGDERNFVKKGVSWALRRMGTRNAALRAAAARVARRLAESPAAAARWVGKDALRDLEKGKAKRPAAGGKVRKAAATGGKAKRPAAGGKARKAAATGGGGKEVDRYMAGVPEPARTTLGKVRASIRAAAPAEATEGISYGMPAFHYQGALVAYAAFLKHCSFFPMSAAVIEAHREELKGYETSKGTIRFAVDKPLPAGLVRKLVKARLAEKEAKKRH